MNVEMLIGIAKPLLKKYADAPLEDQSKIISELVKLFTGWFIGLKAEIGLEPDEDELLLMLKEQEGNLFLVPSIINVSDKFSRVLVDEYGINLTMLSQSIPVPKIILLGLSLFADNPDAQKEVFEQLSAMLSEAANRPECRLNIKPPAPEPEDAAETESQRQADANEVMDHLQNDGAEEPSSEEVTETETEKEEPKVIPLETDEEE